MPLLISSLTMVPKMIQIAHTQSESNIDSISANNTNTSSLTNSEYKSMSLTTIEDYVIPSITSLAIVIKKDVLWKPMNHRLLIFTRPNNSSLLRITAIKTLHRLFEEVCIVYIYIYICIVYVYVCTCVYMYVYVYCVYIIYFTLYIITPLTNPLTNPLTPSIYIYIGW